MLLFFEAHPIARRNVGGTLRLGIQPGVRRLAKAVLLAHAQGERKVRQPDVVLVQQLTQGAQALELGGSIQPVSGGRALGLNEPDAFDIPKEVRDEMEIVFVETIDEALSNTITLPLPVEEPVQKG